MTAVAASRRAVAVVLRRRVTHLAALCLIVPPAVALSFAKSRGAQAGRQVGSRMPIDTTPVAAQYFGLHIHRAVAMTPSESRSAWPPYSGWSWRLWDARVAWKDIEPRRRVFDFARLDSLCNLAREHHVPVLLTLGLTPQWASLRPLEQSNYEAGNQAPPVDMEDWRRYVDTVAKRYRGQIEGYEVWNEPNLRGFFSGSPQELVAMARVAYATIKAADPRAIVVTPSATGVPAGSRWIRKYFAAGGDAYADVVGFHFYVTPRDPEAMLPAFDSVRALLAGTKLGNAPVWNTEAGWLLQNHDVPVLPGGPPGTFGSRVLDDTTAAAFVARALVLGRCGSLSRFYWYAWDNRRMGLTEADGRTLKLPARAFANVRRWLLGSKVRSCRVTTDGVWTVELQGAAGGRASIMWSVDRPRTYTFPDSTELDTRSDLLASSSVSLRRNHVRIIKIGAVPALISYHSVSGTTTAH